MSETKFTPGPWEVCGRGDWIMQDRLHIASVAKTLDGDFFRPNAHLIAAAPEMYEALERLAKGEGLLPGETIEKLLAKARGES